MMACLSQDPGARPTANQLMRQLGAINAEALPGDPAPLRASV